jgi:hypothetical protein
LESTRQRLRERICPGEFFAELPVEVLGGLGFLTRGRDVCDQLFLASLSGVLRLDKVLLQLVK